MKKERLNLFPGSFIVHPVSLISVGMIIFNDFYLKPSKTNPLIAGKLSDISLMVFLPIFLAFIYIFLKYLVNSIVIIFKKEIKEDYSLPYYIIILSIFLSGLVMILLQVSDSFNVLFEKNIIFLKELLSNNRYSKITLTKDIYDLISIPFLLIPYLFLNRYRKENSNN